MKKIYLLLLLISVETTWARIHEWCTYYGPHYLEDFRYLQEYLKQPGPDLVNIRKTDYKKNPEASFCKRPVEMIDTLVIHHSETPSNWTAEQINDFHLTRGTPEDPWYMIAYSFVINAPYSGEDEPPLLVTEGRTLEIVGAHAGTNAFVKMDEVQTKLWEEGQVVCGKEGEEFKIDMEMIKNGKIKANVTTIGIVVSGNYAPFSQTNPMGYSKKNPRYPTPETQDYIARLACQLQKKYPRMKKIGWHSQYKNTECPGSIKDHIGAIKEKTKEYGCEFN